MEDEIMSWIVWDNEDGIVCHVDTYEEALKEYENCKDRQEDWLYHNGEFSGDERVIIAEVKKHFYSHDNGVSVMVEDVNGVEVLTGDTSWEFKEDNYE